MGSHGTDVARYILPAGNYGGLPTNANSRDQLPLYDGLTPLRGNVTDADINSQFIPEDFKPVGATHEEVTGHAGVTILYDSYGVAHVKGDTRADVAFGAGWVTARDRGLLLQLGRGPARAAVADVPGIDAFSLVTSGQSFVPSPQAEALVTAQQDLLVQTYGDKGREILADAQAEADGINAYWAATGVHQPPATVNDVIATAAFIGSIFGAGGGGEATNSDLLAQLQNQLGPVRGHQAWNDAMLSDDPEAPTTTNRHYDYGPLTGGDVTGSVTIDAGSIVALDPRQGAAPHPAPAPAPLTDERGDGGGREHRADHGPRARRRLSRTTAQAGLELPRRGAAALGLGQPAGRDGPAARVLLPGDRPADPPQRARHRGAGRGGPGHGDVHPHRPHPRLRVEPHLRGPRRPRRVRRAAVRARRLDPDAGLDPLRVRRGVQGLRHVRCRHPAGHSPSPIPRPCTARRSVRPPSAGSPTRSPASARRSAATGSTWRRSTT